MMADDDITIVDIEVVIREIDKQEKEHGSGHTSKTHLLRAMSQLSSDQLGAILAKALDEGYVQHVTESGNWTPTGEGFKLIGK
jgi:hypothetical protein